MDSVETQPDKKHKQRIAHPALITLLRDLADALEQSHDATVQLNHASVVIDAKALAASRVIAKHKEDGNEQELSLKIKWRTE